MDLLKEFESKPKAEFDKDGWCAVEGFVMMYNYDENNVYAAPSIEHVQLHCGYPGNSTTIAPPELFSGEVAVWNHEESKWVIRLKKDINPDLFPPSKPMDDAEIQTMLNQRDIDDGVVTARLAAQEGLEIVAREEAEWEKQKLLLKKTSDEQSN